MMTVAAKDERLLLVHVTQLESRVAFWIGFDERPADIFLKKSGRSMVKPRGRNPPILVDPASGHCYPDPTKLCELRVLGTRRTAP